MNARLNCSPNGGTVGLISSGPGMPMLYWEALVIFANKKVVRGAAIRNYIPFRKVKERLTLTSPKILGTDNIVELILLLVLTPTTPVIEKK